MDAAELLSDLQQRGIQVWPEGSDNLRVKGRLDPNTRQLLKALKTQVLSHFRALAAGPDATSYGLTFHGVSIEELKAKAADDWIWIAADQQALEAFASLVQTNNEVAAKRVPARWTGQARCKSCGPIPIFSGADGGNFDGCPWCLVGGYRAGRVR